MRILEARRHSMRDKPGEQLSTEGITLARPIGSNTGPFGLVVTSPAHRAIETAVAMGFAVNETMCALSELPTDMLLKTGWPATFARHRNSAREYRDVEAFAHKQANTWKDIANKVEDGERALLVVHGLFIEMGAIGIFGTIAPTRVGPCSRLLRGLSFYARQ